MKKILILLLLLVGASRYTYSKPDSVLFKHKDGIIRFQIGFDPFIPVSTAARTNYYGLGAPNIKPALGLGVHVNAYKQWVVGVCAQVSFLDIAEDGLRNTLDIKYKDPNHVVTYSNFRGYARGVNFHLSLARRFNVGSISLEPYLRGGYSSYSGMPGINVRRKQIGSNYYEDISVLYPNAQEYLSYSIGLNVSRSILSWLHIYAGAGYTSGPQKLDITHATETFTGKQYSEFHSIQQPLNFVRGELGLQVRVNKVPLKSQ